MSGLKLEKHALAGLDVLRGVAILGVIVAHFLGAYLPKLVEEVSATGGVMLFFLLSGFLIDRTFHQDPSVFRYLVRRGFRIWPMYAATVLAISLLDSKWTATDVIQNLTFTAPHAKWMSGVFWTLYVECLFYALAPLALLSGRVGITLAPFIIVARLAFGWVVADQIAPMWFFLSYCFLGLQIGASWRGYVPPFVPIATAVVITVASGFWSLGPWQAPLSVFCILALYVSLRFNPKNSALSFCGLASYSWYLIHSVVGYTIGWKAVEYLHLPDPIGLSLGALASLGLSYLTYRLIELPGISAGKYIVQWSKMPRTAT